MSTDRVPNLELNDGTEIPQLGFGVFQIPPEDTAGIATQALQAGYRHIDTAKAYGNEAGVGQAVRAAGLERDDVFLTTKLWNGDHPRDMAERALKTSLDQLATEHLDLYLIHWPVPEQDRFVEAWQALVELKGQGLTRSIGVSNFQPHHLERIVAETGVTPSVNQVELHPYFQQAGLRREHADRGIVTEAWSPLAQGAVLDDPVITQIAAEHDVTAGQVVLRWHVQIGNVVIPKSVTSKRIEQNFDVFGFHLSEAQMAAIEGLDRGERIGPDPDEMNRR